MRNGGINLKKLLASWMIRRGGSLISFIGVLRKKRGRLYGGFSSYTFAFTSF